MTWDEYCKVFINFGFELKSGNGSRRSFVDENNHVFHIHEPHPGSIMKPYTIKLSIEKFWYELFGYDFSKLTEWGGMCISSSTVVRELTKSETPSLRQSKIDAHKQMSMMPLN